VTDFRYRWKRQGGHVHVRLFVGDRAAVTHAKAGDLCFSVDEWEAFVRQHAQTEGNTVVFSEDD
jgi:hypothetical protein